MRTLHWKLLPLILLLIPYGLLRLGGSAEASSPLTTGIQQTPDESVIPTPVQLSEVIDAPLVHLGQRVTFAIQFDTAIESWNPLMTRFSDNQWGCFSGWSDDDFTWHRPVHENSFARLYFPRGGLAERLISRARRYERFQVVATVRELLLGEPFLEVEGLEPLFELVDEGSILHVARGLSFALDGKLRLAREQFERARSAPLPPLTRLEVDRLIAQCPSD